MHSSPQRQSYQLLVNFKNCQMASNLTQGWPRNAKQRAINCFVSTSAARQKAATTDDSTSKRDNQMVGGERGKKCTTSTHTHTHAHIHTLQCYTDVCYFAVNIYWWWWWLCGEEVKRWRADDDDDDFCRSVWLFGRVLLQLAIKHVYDCNHLSGEALTITTTTTTATTTETFTCVYMCVCVCVCVTVN